MWSTKLWPCILLASIPGLAQLPSLAVFICMWGEPGNELFIACDCLCFVRSDSPSCAYIYWCADNHHCSAVCGHLCYVQTEEERYSSVGVYASFSLVLHAEKAIMKHSWSIKITFVSAPDLLLCCPHPTAFMNIWYHTAGCIIQCNRNMESND